MVCHFLNDQILSPDREKTASSVCFIMYPDKNNLHGGIPCVLNIHTSHFGFLLLRVQNSDVAKKRKEKQNVLNFKKLH